MNRLSICKTCPLYANDICSSYLYLNPRTNDVSTEPKQGYYKGCGCKISIKIK